MKDNDTEQYDYSRLLKRREWLERRNAILALSPHCQKCGRTGCSRAVHHLYYDYGRLPWDYPDEAFMIVCNGRCHREADEDREEQQRDARNFKRFGWQWELGRKELMPREKERRKLAKHEAAFKAWLSEEGIPPDGWDWNSQLYPLWWFWNQFSDQFFAQQGKRYSQGWLFNETSSVFGGTTAK